MQSDEVDVAIARLRSAADVLAYTLVDLQRRFWSPEFGATLDRLGLPKAIAELPDALSRLGRWEDNVAYLRVLRREQQRLADMLAELNMMAYHITVDAGTPAQQQTMELAAKRLATWPGEIDELVGRLKFPDRTERVLATEPPTSPLESSATASANSNEWSTIDTKKALAGRLNLSPKVFASYCKNSGHELRQMGRQQWQVCLTGMPESDRRKLRS